MSQAVTDITYQNFSNFVEASKNRNSILYFSASWCGPCKMAKYVIEDLVKKNKDKVVFGKVDVDDCRAIAEDYDISTVPSFIHIKGKEIVDRFPLSALSFKIENMK